MDRGDEDEHGDDRYQAKDDVVENDDQEDEINQEGDELEGGCQDGVDEGGVGEYERGLEAHDDNHQDRKEEPVQAQRCR